MSPENDRDSQHFKLPYFATCLPSRFTKEAIFPNRVVGVAGSNVIGYTKGGATASVNGQKMVI